MPVERLSMSEAVICYRDGWCLERDFHLLKDRPLGISPLYVRRDDQIIGLTHLLTLALRLQTLLEMQLRQQLAETDEPLTGLYEGQPKRTTDRPTATRVLKAFARAEITLTRIEMGERHLWHVTPLPELLVRILRYAGLPISLYTALAENSS
jgi:transposase